MKKNKFIQFFLFSKLIIISANSVAEETKMISQNHIVEVRGVVRVSEGVDSSLLRLVAKDIAKDKAEAQCESVLVERISAWTIKLRQAQDISPPWKKTIEVTASAKYRCSK